MSARRRGTSRIWRGALADVERIAKVGVWHWDLRDDSLQWSDSLYRIFGLDPRELPPAIPRQQKLFSAQGLDGLRAIVGRIRPGETHELEIEAPHADGTLRWVVIRSEIECDLDGHVIAARGTLQDITERKHEERARLQTEQRFRLAMRNAPIGKALVGLDGRWSSINEAFAQMLGYTEVQLMAMSFDDLAPPGALPTDKRICEALGASGDRYRGEERFFHADGRIVRAQVDVSVLRDAQGAPAQYILQMQDITERLRLEEEQRALTQRLELALQVSGIGVWDLDLDSGRVEIDDAMRRMYGWPVGTRATREKLMERVLPGDWSRMRAAVRAAIEQRGPQGVEFRIEHPQMGWRYIECTLALVTDSGHAPRRVVGVNFDVTERMQTERLITEGRALLRNLIDNLPLWVSMVDRDGRYAVINRRAAAILGHLPEQIEGRVAQPYRETTLPGSIRDAQLRALQRAESVECSGELIEDGRPVQVQAVIVPIAAGALSGYTLSVFSDVTDLKRTEARLEIANRQLQQRVAEVLDLQDKLREQAIRDGLTGLHNRRYFDELIGGELRRLGEPGACLLMADLDHFKRLNDRHGHLAGDAMLRAWSAVIRQLIRPGDLACRYGGEEFVLLLPRTAAADGLAFAEQLRAGLAALSVPFDAECLRCTVSIGVAHVASPDLAPDELVRRADAALYRAKSAGRDCVLAAPG